MLVGDLKARDHKWYNHTNAIGKATVKFARLCNLQITAPPSPSYSALGRVGQSSPDLLLDLFKAKGSQPKDPHWGGASDHTPLVYDVTAANIRADKRHISKTMLNNKRNAEEAGERYRTELPRLIKEVRKSVKKDDSKIYNDVTKALLVPWNDIVKRKSSTKCSHWNASLHTKLKSLLKVRKRARSSGMSVDEDEFWRTRKSFQNDNRRRRWQFTRRTEKRLVDGPNGNIAEAIKTERRRRKRGKEHKRRTG